jgi:hypothetical protein
LEWYWIPHTPSLVVTHSEYKVCYEGAPLYTRSSDPSLAISITYHTYQPTFTTLQCGSASAPSSLGGAKLRQAATGGSTSKYQILSMRRKRTTSSVGEFTIFGS